MNPAIEAAFAVTLQRISYPGWAPDFFTPRAVVGPEFDTLEVLPEPGHLSQVQQQLLAALRAIKPKFKLAVLTMMCNDAPYIAEFVAHYRVMGAERIFVYTNDNSDSTYEVLRWFEANGLVTVLPMVTAGKIHIQRKNYHHALYLLPELRLFEWVAVVDSDEFLLPDARYGHNLSAMLDAAPADVEAILFPWHWRLGPVSFEPVPGLLAERYVHANQWDHAKSVIRLRHVRSLHQLHYPYFDGVFQLHDTMFDRVVGDADRADRRCTGAGGWTEHFWGKSFAEYVVKKQRGDAPAALDSAKSFAREYKTYFEWSQACTPDNYAPWPEAVLAGTKAWLARFAGRPGYAALQAKWEADFAAHVAATRGDSEMRRMFAEMQALIPR